MRDPADARNGRGGTCECVHRRADGTLLPLEVSTVRADIGGEHLVLCVARDVAQRRRRELLQAIVHEIDSAILAGQTQEAPLEFICSQLVSLNGYALVQISIKERDGLVSIQGSAGAAAGFLDDIHVRWDSGSESPGPPDGQSAKERFKSATPKTIHFEVWRARAAP